MHPGGKRDGENEHGRCADLAKIVREHLSDDRGDENCHQNCRNGERDIADPHQEIIGKTAKITGHKPGSHADDQGKRHRGDTNDDRYARAVEDSGEHIAPLRIRAEQKGPFTTLLPHRRQFGLPHVERSAVIRILRCDQRRENGGED
ncbi:hypothetical protein D3C80_1537620 [compost metagenome]